MNRILKEREEYLNKKLSHLLFEILEFPEKKEILYLGLCYCQLSRAYSVDEIPISEIRRCLNRYLIDFDSYPWRDYLLELELFYLRDSEDTLVKGAGLITYTPSEETTLNIDPKYGFLKHNFCQKVYRYWYITQKWENFRAPVNAFEVIENGIKLYNEGLYGESLNYVEDYIPLFRNGEELLLYRVLKSLAYIGLAVDSKNYKEAQREIENLLNLLKEFSKELKKTPYDFKKLGKDLKRLKSRLNSKGKFYIEPVRVFRKSKKGLFKRFLGFLKGFGASG